MTHSTPAFRSGSAQPATGNTDIARHAPGAHLRHWTSLIADWLNDPAANEPVDLTAATRAFAREDRQDLAILLEVLLAPAASSARPERLRHLLQWMAGQLIARGETQLNSAKTEEPLLSASTLAELYQRWFAHDTESAAHVLQCLAAQGDSESIATLAHWIDQQPPSQWQLVGVGLSPLWQAAGSVVEQFFAHLGQAPVNPATLAVLLDLANHTCRQGRLSPHPWRPRLAELTGLLRQLTIRLEKLERDPSQFGSQVTQVQQVLNDSLALTLSVCDALGWIGQAEAADALVETMELSHRRLQTEAAAALARLGDRRGVARLVELAADPVARSRVVHYAEELELLGQIDERLRTPQALAESELAAWLSSPQQFGLPPERIEWLDSRTLYWPGYEEPRDCYLFRFSYQLPRGAWSSVGIAGPVTEALACDLTGLEGEDIYAAYAGWQVEHEEIFEVPPARFNSARFARLGG